MYSHRSKHVVWGMPSLMDILPYLHKVVTALASLNLARKVILLGPFARGRGRKDTPIDLLIVSDSGADVRKLCERVNRELEADGFGNRIRPQVVREREIPIKRLSDALQLWGCPIQMSARKVGLSRKFIVNYDTSGLSAASRARLFRALYGYRTRSKIKGKVYESKVDGMVAKPGVERLGTSALLVGPDLLKDVVSIVEGAGGKIKVLEVWT